MAVFAKRFGLSDVAVAKTCRYATIPLPPRGYWARKRVGKAATVPRLPLREPGQNDTVIIGQSDYYYNRPRRPLTEIPQPPVFDEPLDQMRDRLRKKLGRIKAPKALLNPDKQIQRYLQRDEKRRAEQLEHPYAAFLYRTYFDNDFEQRRFRLLNALVQSALHVGCSLVIRGDCARDLYFHVRDQSHHISLDTPDGPTDQAYGPPRTEKAKQMRLSIRGGHQEKVRSWQDDESGKLETRLTDIVFDLIMMAEVGYREGRQAGYLHALDDLRERRLAAKVGAIEEWRTRRQKRLAQKADQVQRLLREAAALRQARDIRQYVADVEAGAPDSAYLSAWASWARGQADRIDPIKLDKWRTFRIEPDEFEHAVDLARQHRLRRRNRQSGSGNSNILLQTEESGPPEDPH